MPLALKRLAWPRVPVQSGPLKVTVRPGDLVRGR